MKEAFAVTVEVEDNFTQEIFVSALPPAGAVLNLDGRGTFKVKEVEFRGSGATESQPLRVFIRCVPILHF